MPCGAQGDAPRTACKSQCESAPLQMDASRVRRKSWNILQHECIILYNRRRLDRSASFPVPVLEPHELAGKRRSELREKRLEKHRTLWKIILIGMLVAFTLSLHYMLLPAPHWIHLLHRRLCYFPIVLAGLWFGLRGGLAVSGMIAAATLPLALGFQGPLSENQDLLEIGFYLGLGLLTGFLVDRREAERTRREDLQGQLAESERLAALGRMAAGVAHEVRTPLGSIQGAAEILGEDYGPEHPRRPFFEILLQEIARLNHVVQDFLDLGRPITVKVDELEAGPLIEACFQSLRGLAQERGVELVSMAGPGCPAVADRARLHQALTNLVRNAIQASPREGHVEVAAARERDGCLITVQDQGPGLPEADVPRLFEPFYTRRKEGTGLGLALVRQVAQAHGGWVRGENRLEGGARFWLWLPDRGRV